MKKQDKYLTNQKVLRLFFTGLIWMICLHIQSQSLETLCPVINPKINKDTNTFFILGTLNYSRFDPGVKQYSNAIQIIAADRSWPPLWYSAMPLYTREQYQHDSLENKISLSQIGLPEVKDGVMSYLQLSPAAQIDTTDSNEWQFDYFFIVLDKQLNRIDTLKRRLLYGGNYGPDIRNNRKIEKLWATRKDGLLDLSRVTGDNKDKAVLSTYWVIEVTDQDDHIKWTWNPILHSNPKLFQIKEKLAKRSADSKEKVTWLKLENFGWDKNGNILYSLEDGGGDLAGFALNGGIGAVSRSTGDILWHFDCYGDSLTANLDTLKCVQPFDLKLIAQNDTASFYSFYDWGYQDVSLAKGVVFEKNDKTGKLKLIKYIFPRVKYVGNGHGGFDYDNSTGNYLIEYGVFEWSDTATGSFRNSLEYGKGDSVYAVFQLPKKNYSFGMHRLENWPMPPRPVMIQKGDQLTAQGNGNGWIWYKLEGPMYTLVKKIGTGNSINIEKGSTYCLAIPYGIGYAVSLPLTIRKNDPY